MIFSENFLRHFTWLHTNFRVESVKWSGVKGAKGEGWYGETKGETWWRPGRDRFLGLDSSSIGFYVQKYLLMPIFKTRRPVSPSQIGAQRSQRSGTESALKFKLSKVRMCWQCKKKCWNAHVTAPTCFLYNKSIRLGFAITCQHFVTFSFLPEHFWQKKARKYWTHCHPCFYFCVCVWVSK